MQTAVINIENLGLPPFVMEKIGGNRAVIKEVAEGILLSPVKSDLRGKYRGVISTERFLVQKSEDKELET